MDTRISIKSIRNRVKRTRSALSRKTILQYRQTARTIQFLLLINRCHKCKDADLEPKQASSLKTGGLIINLKLKRVGLQTNKSARGRE